MRTALLLVLTLAAGCRGTGVGSIGAVLARDGLSHAVVVREAPKGLGAEQAGILPGDELVMIDGFLVRELSTAELRALMRGEVGSKVRLTIVRAGQVRHLDVRRTELVESARKR